MVPAFSRTCHNVNLDSGQFQWLAFSFRSSPRSARSHLGYISDKFFRQRAPVGAGLYFV